MSGHDRTLAAGLALPQALRLLQAVPHGLVVLDQAGLVAFVNEAGARLLAWPADADLVGRSWREQLRLRRGRAARARCRRAGARRGELDGRRDGAPPRRRPRAARGAHGAARRRPPGARAARRVRDARAPGAPRRPRAPGPAHRAPEPAPLRGPSRDRARAGSPLPPARGAHLHRPRSLQAGQRRASATPRATSCCAPSRSGSASACAKGTRVARLGGDEFTLLLPGIHHAEDLAAISRKLVEALREPYRIGGRELRVTASGGISLYPEDGEESRGAAEVRRHRDVPRQGARPRQLPAVLAGDGGEGARAALARGRAAGGARQAGDDARLPAVPRARDRARGGGRGAPALAAAEPRRRCRRGTSWRSPTSPA